MIVTLLILMIVIGVVAFFINKKDLCHPATLFSATYIISVLCACLNIDTFDVDMIPATFAILLFGYIEFILISTILSKRLLKKKCSGSTTTRVSIHLPLIIVVLSAIYCVAVLPLVAKSIMDLAGQYGEFDSFSQALTIYRDHTHHTSDAKLPQYIYVLIKPVIAAAYIYTYIFLYNVINRHGKLIKMALKNSLLLFFPIAFVALSFIESNRGPIINFGLGMACLAIILWVKKHNSLFVPTIRRAVAFVAICVVSLLSFYAVTPLIGRINSKGLFDYITFYIGGSIECFNEWEKNPDDVIVVPGEYTFPSTIQDLGRLKVIQKVELKNEDRDAFIYTEAGEMVGNVYTSYRGWQHDYGIPGIIILQAGHAIIITALYCSIMKKRTRAFGFKVLLFGYMTFTVFMHPIDNYLYINFPTIVTTTLLFLFFVLMWLVRWFSKPCNSETTEFYYLREVSNASAYNASSKARADAEVIMSNNAIQILDVYSKPGVFRIKIFKPLQLFTYFRNSMALYDALYNAPSNAVIFVQYPIANNTFFLRAIVNHFKKKGMTFVAVVHDMDSLRYTIDAQGKTVYNRAVYYDTKVLPLFSHIISHNTKMSEELKTIGVDEKTIINLGIFDYLSDTSNCKYTDKERAIFAGNLDPAKSKFLYVLPKEIAESLSLYGKNFSAETADDSLNYCGSFADTNNIKELAGSFGLVWDGDSYETCSGKFGEYLKYNNPHKASMYIAMGLPIIIWKDAAIADFVTKNTIGYTISSLEELPKIVKSTSKKDYAEKVKNIEKISKNVTTGYYLDSAIKEVKSKING